MTQYSGKVIRKTPVTPTQQAASGVWKLNEQAAAIRNNNWPVAGVPNPISRSVRFRSSASAYFNRTPASASNRRTMTLSMWQKRGEFASSQEPAIMWAGTGGSNYTLFRWGDGVGNADSKFKLNLNMFSSSTTNINLVTTPIYRDPSAWYHIVLSIDTTQGTAANRVRLYINGIEVTSFSSATYPSQNLDLLFNSTNAHEIGRFSFGSYLDGYMTEVNFIDGQQLTPSSFGTTDPLTGVWEPIAYTGTYGTNGFYLNFKDNTSTTTIGYDYSGNSNNWTANNISLTVGSTYDSMLDVPTQWIGYSTTTDTSAVTRGNYAVWNPLITGATYSNANLQVVSTNSTFPNNLETSIKTPTTGKWYAEITATVGSGSPLIGLGNNFPDQYAAMRSNNTFVTSGMGATSTGTSPGFSTGNIIGIAYDVDAGTITFYRDGIQYGGFTGVTAGNYSFIVRKDSASGDGGTLNAGQRPFTYTPPSGFKSLNTTNLPNSTIVQGNQWMDATTYTGTGSALSITNSGSMQPDMVWIKARSAAENNFLFDSVRGTSPNYSRLSSNLTDAEAVPGITMLSALNSNGFTLGTNGGVNTNAMTAVAWQWKANGTPAVTNTAGSITSTVSANTTAGFSVVSYTGNGSSGATIGHGLGVALNMIIIKNRPSTYNWRVGHSSLPSWTNFLQLDGTNAQGSNNVIFNGTAPTSTVFTVGNDVSVNASGQAHIAYCWVQVAGFSKFGSYTGNGSSSGPFVYLGFRPEYIMIKRTDTTASWLVVDAARSPDNTSVNGGMKNVLFPNLSNAEDTGADICDGLSNGFKFYQGAASFNANGGTYIYMAFAQNPFKNALAR